MRVPYIGAVLLYSLTKKNAEEINRRRTDSKSIRERLKADPPQWPAGAQAHIGNSASAGDLVPLVVVRPWWDGDAYVPGTSVLNGQVLLDGNDTFWVTSAKESVVGSTWSPGEWRWSQEPEVPEVEQVQTPAHGGPIMTMSEIAEAEGMGIEPAPPKPSLGRIVHYRKGVQEPRAAVISGLHDDGLLGLTVFTDNQANPVIVVRAPEIDPAQPGTGWYWPPRS